MPFTTVISPLGQPLHLDAAKAHLRVDGTDDDDNIKALIASATQAAEAKTHHQLLHARFTHTQDCFTRSIRLPHAPVVNVVSVQYLGMDGLVDTVDPADYIVNYGTPATITPVFGTVWPIAMPQESSVFVTYEAGYASPFTATATTGNLTVNGPYAYTVGQRVTFSNSGGALPAPLDADTAYLIEHHFHHHHYGRVVVTRLRHINNDGGGSGVLCKCNTAIYKKVDPSGTRRYDTHSDYEKDGDILCVSGEAQVFSPR